MAGKKSSLHHIVASNGTNEFVAHMRDVFRKRKLFGCRAKAVVCDELGHNVDFLVSQVATPTAILLFTEYHNRKPEGSPSPSREWWASSNQDLRVYVFGSNSATMYEDYALNCHVKEYLGYRGEVNFFTGTEKARKHQFKLLRGIGQQFIESTRTITELKRAISEEYTGELQNMSDTYQGPEDRIAMIFLEEQLQGLTHFVQTTPSQLREEPKSGT